MRLRHSAAWAAFEPPGELGVRCSSPSLSRGALQYGANGQQVASLATALAPAPGPYNRGSDEAWVVDKAWPLGEVPASLHLGSATQASAH